jgi:hypothetical protein
VAAAYISLLGAVGPGALRATITKLTVKLHNGARHVVYAARWPPESNPVSVPPSSSLGPIIGTARDGPTFWSCFFNRKCVFRDSNVVCAFI